MCFCFMLHRHGQYQKVIFSLEDLLHITLFLFSTASLLDYWGKLGSYKTSHFFKRRKIYFVQHVSPLLPHSITMVYIIYYIILYYIIYYTVLQVLCAPCISGCRRNVKGFSTLLDIYYSNILFCIDIAAIFVEDHTQYIFGRLLIQSWCYTKATLCLCIHTKSHFPGPGANWNAVFSLCLIRVAWEICFILITEVETAEDKPWDFAGIFTLKCWTWNFRGASCVVIRWGRDCTSGGIHN